ncbi:family 43 glycosylhydrolase, partial [Chitinophaga sp.]|uniref:family 43 glycosylhydrolase n=1 Tax=Chitinophaga sp. TaxID=1869181 RepID=UPI002FDDBFA0
VAEGPTVLLHKKTYYLIYSSNDFRNKDYAVGYATSSSPTGPWKKYTGNPVINRQMVGHNGSGHGDVLYDKAGKMRYVLHTHRSENRVSPRPTAIIDIRFRPGSDGIDILEADAKTFRWLEAKD